MDNIISEPGWTEEEVQTARRLSASTAASPMSGMFINFQDSRKVHLLVGAI
jgi:hypothetical protein